MEPAVLPDSRSYSLNCSPAVVASSPIEALKTPRRPMTQDSSPSGSAAAARRKSSESRRRRKPLAPAQGHNIASPLLAAKGATRLVPLPLGSEQCMALRCVVHRPASSTPASPPPAGCASADPSGESQIQKFILIPSSVTVASLVEFVLGQLNIEDPASKCIAKVVLPGWKTLSLGEICSDTDGTTVCSLLGHLSNIAVLRIQLPPVPPPPPLCQALCRRLLRSLLPMHTDDRVVQLEWLRMSGCPLSETDLTDFLAAPRSFDFPEPARVALAAWRRRLRRLARSLFAPPAASGASDLMEVDDATKEGDETATASTTLAVPTDEGESGFGDDPAGDENCVGDGTDDGDDHDDSKSTQAALERLSRLSRIPRRPAAAASFDKENSSGQATGTPNLSLPPQRNRLFIDPHTEIPELERHFAANAHPTAADCRRIADELNTLPFRLRQRRQMAPKNIRLWFKNRRARARRVDAAVGGDSPGAAATPTVAVAASPIAAPAAQQMWLPLLPQPPPQLQMRLPIASSGAPAPAFALPSV